MGEQRARVLIIGAGGHAKVCLEALRDDAAHDVIGAVSSDGWGADGLDTAVLGLESDLERLVREHHVDRVFVAVGDNAARAAVTNRCDVDGYPSATAISRFAMVSHSARILGGSAVLAGAVVNAGATIGRGTIVNTGAAIDHDCVVCDFAHVAPGVTLAGGVRVGAGTHIGVGARVLPHVVIGARAVVVAGAVVTHDVSDGSMVSGVPARQGRQG